MKMDEYVGIIKNKLSPSRAEHSLRVAAVAMELAERQEINREQAYLAALFHDYAKDMPPRQLLSLGRENNLITCQAEELQPDLLHGPVGAFLCKKELGIRDEEILQAIKYHTTGRAQMTPLEIIIYLADLIEPGRKYKGVNELRVICRDNLLDGLLYAFDATITYVLERKFLIHYLTVEARNWLLTSTGNQVSGG